MVWASDSSATDGVVFSTIYESTAVYVCALGRVPGRAGKSGVFGSVW